MFLELLQRASEPGAISMAIGPLAAMAIPAGMSLLSGLLGHSAAKRQARAIEQANAPKPFERTTERTPWDPTTSFLESLPAIAQGIFESRMKQGPPPMFRGGGSYSPSSSLQSILDATRSRALGSSFVPQAQSYLLNQLGRPNPMVNEVFQRAMSYRNPYLNFMLDRGVSGGLNQATPFMSGFLSNLLGGQTRLGGME